MATMNVLALETMILLINVGNGTSVLTHKEWAREQTCFFKDTEGHEGDGCTPGVGAVGGLVRRSKNAN